MTFYLNPFFWALLSMLGEVGATSMFTSHKLARNPIFVAVVLILSIVGRVVLVLPFCPQPRFELAGWNWLVGGGIIFVALLFGVPASSIRWFDPPDHNVKLRTTGVYAVVRHPMYLCEVIWFLGWSVMFRSTYGLALVPVWWLAMWLHTLGEEVALEKALGSEYLEYKKRVRGRIFPSLRVK